MGTPSTSQTISAGPATPATVGLAEQVSFQQIFLGLEQKGITLNAVEKARFEEIARDEIRKQNNGQLVGMNIPGAGLNLIQILFSFIQNLFSSGNGTPELSLAGLSNSLLGAGTSATNNGKQYVINTINANIYDRMRAEGGNLSQAADLVTGLATGGDNARDMNHSLMRQLTTAQGTQGVTTTLNRPTTVADASAGNGLPASVTRPLTPPTLGA